MAVGKFVHSFDRESFSGLAETRQDALQEALAKLPDLDTSPDTIYIGKRVLLDPGSSGLAELVLGAMRRRVREESGLESAGNDYLRNVNEHQLAELDDQIDRVIQSWLNKHGLSPTSSKVVAISEHPVPLSKMVEMI